MIETDINKIEIGSRIICDNHFGTVLYKGEVPPAQGLWLGIDWDDPNRGKHDGSHEGNRYFFSRYPNSGSFVRISKIECGISFCHALQSRYGKSGDEENILNKEDCFINTILNNPKEIEVIGIDTLSHKQSQFDKLEEVVLHNMKIFQTSPEDKLQVLTPNIVDLDLSRNLLPSWNAVAEITSQLPHLKILNLSENRLELPTEPMKISEAFFSVKILILNKMNYTWPKILACTEMFASLEHLVVCFNLISTIENISSVIQKLRILDLANNPLKDWNQVLQLGNLPCLEILNVSHCHLQEIVFPGCLANASCDLFSSLKSISLGDNLIDNWSSVNELNKLHSLQELKIKNNPVLFPENPETTRQLLIAKIKTLTMCNRSLILTEERRGAELDYLKKFGPLWLLSGGHQDPGKNNPSADFIAAHPRYQDLIKKYGAPDDSELKVETTTLKNNLINIKITFPDAEAMRSSNKKIPVTMTVQKLLTLIQRLYKIDSQNLKLSYSSSKVPDLEVTLDNVMKEIAYYSIENGDTVYVRW